MLFQGTLPASAKAPTEKELLLETLRDMEVCQPHATSAVSVVSLDCCLLGSHTSLVATTLCIPLHFGLDWHFALSHAMQQHSSQFGVSIFSHPRPCWHAMPGMGAMS